MNIGIVGCGNISETYFECQKIYNNFKIIACADIYKEAASNAASKYNVKALSVEEILENNEIDLIINLTIPAAHKEIISKSLQNNTSVKIRDSIFGCQNSSLQSISSSSRHFVYNFQIYNY